MLLPSLSLVALLTGLAYATPTPAPSMYVHAQRTRPARGFVALSTASSDHLLDMRIHLAQRDPAGLRAVLDAVSDPSHPQYGQYLSRAQVESFTRPTDETRNAVNNWLATHGLNATDASSAGDWIAVQVPASVANTMLGAEYTLFAHERSNSTLVRTLSYSLPLSLQGHVKTVWPGTSCQSSNPAPQPTSAPAPQIPAPTPGKTDASCKNTVTPKCLQQLYQIPTTRAKVASNKIGVTAYINQFGQKSDLRSFLQQFRPDIDDSNTGFNTQSIDGGVNPQGSGSAGVEANLDLQYTIGLATGVPTTFITVGNQGRNGFLDTITQLLASDSPPQVLTTSYGQSEDDVAPQDAEAMCNAYMQLGARGVSILFASGDSGVGDSNDECKRDGKFQPTFPAGCPFLTAVGSTDGIAPERGASFSSGGFSELFAQPSYQSAHIATFLSRSSVPASSGRFNPSGRAFPDVSTLGTRFAVINAGRTTGVQGTSASSPVFASIIALLNDERAQRGMPPLGFLNPWLYGKASGAFMDVVEGNNPGCGTDGFEAAKGWDPVTGLGTPSYPALRVAAGLA
ncbi:family S53 protease-like protein [Exidia glandulosa HHB12029]|uniref:tripeptidyl-peptidase II n=1 Tax=Exidia glandulosa HHB12029 TaxID=1314781 RepID=A0A165JT43_EXIGL|nr:family S53 protease-like protein [Exidia glandulosa HHB12029]